MFITIHLCAFYMPVQGFCAYRHLQWQKWRVICTIYLFGGGGGGGVGKTHACFNKVQHTLMSSTLASPIPSAWPTAYALNEKVGKEFGRLDEMKGSFTKVSQSERAVLLVLASRKVVCCKCVVTTLLTILWCVDSHQY